MYTPTPKPVIDTRVAADLAKAAAQDLFVRLECLVTGAVLEGRLTPSGLWPNEVHLYTPAQQHRPAIFYADKVAIRALRFGAGPLVEVPTVYR